LGARQAIFDHVRHWNAMDKDAWLALFAEDVVYEDPPGTVASQGKQVMSDHAWDRSFTDHKRWILEPVKIVESGNEAQVYMRNHGAVGGLPVVAGAAAAFAVAIVMAICYRGGYRASRDIFHHGVATIGVLGLLTLAASDMRHAALVSLGITPSQPAVEFEIRLPKAATVLADASRTQLELRAM